MKNGNIRNLGDIEEKVHYNRLLQDVLNHKKGSLNFPDNKIKRLLSGINSDIVHGSIYVNRSVDDLDRTNIELKTKFFNKENISKFSSFKNSFSKLNAIKIAIPAVILGSVLLKKFISNKDNAQTEPPVQDNPAIAQVTQNNASQEENKPKENSNPAVEESKINKTKRQLSKVNKAIKSEDKIILDKSDKEYDSDYSNFNNQYFVSTIDERVAEENPKSNSLFDIFNNSSIKNLLNSCLTFFGLQQQSNNFAGGGGEYSGAGAEGSYTPISSEGATKFGKSPLANLIARGEGNYNSFNSGTVNGRIIHSGTKNLSDYTINQILASSSLPATDSRRIFAAGRYQVIAPTLRGAVKIMNLSGNEKFTPEMQDKILEGALLPKAVRNYIHGKSNDSQAAMIALAQQWRSFADPRTGATYGDRGARANKASITAAESLAALNATRAYISNNKIPDSHSSGNATDATGTNSVGVNTGNLKNIPSNLINIGKSSIVLGRNVNIRDMNPTFMSYFYGLVGDYYSQYKQKVPINSAFRSYQEQAILYKTKKPGQAARPGTSAHESGKAIDISSAVATKMDVTGLLGKYGFHRPVRGEAWHLENYNVPRNANAARLANRQQNINTQSKNSVAVKSVKSNSELAIAQHYRKKIR